MHNSEDLLFSDFLKKLPCKQGQSLFNEIGQNDNVAIDVIYVFLKETKILSSEITIEKNQPLIGVGFSEETLMVNVYKSFYDTDIYFWIDVDDIDKMDTALEEWSSDEVNRHKKAIKESWITLKK